MYPIGCISAMVNYWIDKFLFLRFHRKPPQYDHKLSSKAKDLLKFSIFIHIISFLMVYANQLIMFYDHHAEIYEVITHAYDEILEFLFKKNNDTLKEESLEL